MKDAEWKMHVSEVPHFERLKEPGFILHKQMQIILKMTIFI